MTDLAALEADLLRAAADAPDLPALEAVRVAQERNLTPGGADGVNCAEVLSRPPPEPVERCVVSVEGGKRTATLTLERNRVFRVAP